MVTLNQMKNELTELTQSFKKKSRLSTNPNSKSKEIKEILSTNEKKYQISNQRLLTITLLLSSQSIQSCSFIIYHHYHLSIILSKYLLSITARIIIRD